MSKTMEKPIFKTLLTLPETKGMPTGNQYDNTYEYVIKENLIKGLEKTGEINRYEKIQLHAAECEISTILAKAAVDPTILQNRKGMFLDVSEQPKSLAEYENMRIKVIQEFGKLDLETRKKFDNSVEKFVAEYGSEEWAEKLGINTIEDVKKTVETVIEKPVETVIEEGGNKNE